MDEIDSVFSYQRLEDVVFDDNGQIDIDAFFEILHSQMSNYKADSPKFDLFKLFVEKGIGTPMSDIGNINTRIDSLYEEEFEKTINRFREEFDYCYGLNVQESDLETMYSLYKVLTLNIDMTFVNFMKGMGSKQNKYVDDPEEYTVLGSVTPEPINSLTGESVDFTKSCENIQIVNKIESIESSFKNLFDKCCDFITNDTFFELALICDPGNVDLESVYKKIDGCDIFVTDSNFFKTRIMKEVSNDLNYDHIKTLYFS